MFSIVTVASSTRMPTARDRPPRVITFRVWPMADRAVMEHSTASGIDTAMISEDRQLPRNSRIIREVSAAAITPSRITPETAAFTKTDWSPSRSTLNDGGNVCSSRGRTDFTPSTILSVEAAPLLSTVISTEREPFTRTTLVWGGEPSRTKATSRMEITAPFTVLIGRALSSW